MGNRCVTKYFAAKENVNPNKEENVNPASMLGGQSGMGAVLSG